MCLLQFVGFVTSGREGTLFNYKSWWSQPVEHHFTRKTLLNINKGLFGKELRKQDHLFAPDSHSVSKISVWKHVQVENPIHYIYNFRKSGIIRLQILKVQTLSRTLFYAYVLCWTNVKSQLKLAEECASSSLLIYLIVNTNDRLPATSHWYGFLLPDIQTEHTSYYIIH